MTLTQNTTLYPKRFLIALALVMLLGSSLATLAGGNEVRLRAKLSAPAAAGDVSGQADFRQRRDRRQFSVAVEGFTPGDIFDVMVAGETVGSITIDALGMGDLNFDDNFEPGADDPATQFPANFPALDGGELVQVGPLTGTLQRK